MNEIKSRGHQQQKEPSRRICELEDMIFEIIQSEGNREKKDRIRVREPTWSMGYHQKEQSPFIGLTEGEENRTLV